MSTHRNRLKPHKDEKNTTYQKKDFDVNDAFAQKKLNRHVLIGMIGTLFGNRIIGLIYLYHIYKVYLLLNGKNEDKKGKERSYYIRLCILRELTIIAACFRAFLFVIFCIGLINAFDNLGMI